MRQRSTSRFEAALPISERQVPSPDKPEKADRDEAELAVAGIIIDDLTASEVPEAPVSFGGAGEQAAARTAMASRTGIWRMTAPRFAAHPNSIGHKEKIVSASQAKTSIRRL